MRQHLLKIIGSGYRKAVLKNIGWLFADKFLRYGVSAVVGVLLVRYLGPEDFGIYRYAVSIVTIFGVVATLALKSVIIRDLSRKKITAEIILGTSAFLMVFASIVSFSAAVIAAYMLRSEDKQTLLLVGIMSVGFFFRWSETIVNYYDSRVESRYVLLASLFGIFCGAFARLALIFQDGNLIDFSIVYALEAVLIAIGLAIYYVVREGSIGAWRWNSEYARSLVRDGAPLVITEFAVLLYMRMDQIMMRELSDESSAGIYAAAVAFVELWYFLPLIVVQSFMPGIIRDREKDYTQYVGNLERLIKLVLAIGLLISIFVTILGPHAIDILYGEQYEGSKSVAQVLIWVILLVGLGTIRTVYVVTEDLFKMSLVSVILGVVVNFTLNFILIPRMGAHGAAIATIASQFIAIYLCMYFLAGFKEMLFLTNRAICRPLGDIGKNS